MPLTVSVVIPVYNAQEYIETCLQSLLAQSYRPLEIICVDDASTDGTFDKISAGPARVLRLDKRGGPGPARNAGARQAKGDVLVFMDVDIRLDRLSLQKIVEHISRPGIDEVSAIYTKDLPEEADFYSHFQNLLSIYRNFRLPRTAAATFSFFCAVKKDVFEKIGGYNRALPYYEDMEIGHRLVAQGFHCELDDGLEVAHMKVYNHRDLIREYFRKTSTALAYAHSGEFLNKISSDNCPLHIKIAGISTFFVTVSIGLLPLSPWPLLLALGSYVVFISPVAVFFIQRRGLMFGLAAAVFCFEVFLVSFAASLYGILFPNKCLNS